MHTVFVFVLIAHGIVQIVSGHGMLLNPVSRGSRWRYDTRAPINYDDNQLFCGGFTVQWSLNGGKCGLCGDDYRAPVPRQHENGGFYGRGVITEKYKTGSFVPISVYITANHFGYFLFDICNLSVEKTESDQCFFRNKLRISNGSDRYRLPNGLTGWFNTTVVLPQGLTCNHCVLRWTYITGNSWGNCSDGSGAIGCGAQENFRGCADIGIIGSLNRNAEEFPEDVDLNELNDDFDQVDEIASLDQIDSLLLNKLRDSDNAIED